MRQGIIMFVGVLVLILLISCTSKQSLEKEMPQTNIMSSPAVQLSKKGWEQEWDKTLQAAKKEGKVVVIGPPGSDIRRALVEDFSKDYPDITVDYSGMPGAAAVPKIRAERRAGLNVHDIQIAGTAVPIALKDIAQPIEPLLILPEVKDGKYWMDGKLDYADTEGKFNLMFVAYVRIAMIYNPQLLEPKKAQEMSYWDLTKPEFKGKIIMADPRISGPGQSFALFLYLHPKMGPDFLKAFYNNDVLLSRDHRQTIEWVSRGKYTIGLAADEMTLASLRKAGIQNVKNQPRLKEGTYLTAGFGSLMVPDNIPHPNATKIYLNWFLSKKGQTAWVAGAGTPARRLDVEISHLDSDILLEPGVTYINSSKEDIVQYRDEATNFQIELIGR